MRILGIDGLHPQKVEELNLENLKQVEHGELTVPINKKHGVPLSPEVWYAFLTGKKKHKEFEGRSNTHKLLAGIKQYIPLSLGLSKKMRKHGLNKSIISYPPLDSKTFLEECNYKGFNVPYYDFKISKFSQLSLEWIQGKVTTEHFKRVHERDFEDWESFVREQKTSCCFFAYTSFFDCIQHCFYQDEEYINKKYVDLDAFVGKLPEQKTMLLSDHGLENGRHTMKGFYSLSWKEGLENPHIIDLHDLICPPKPNQKEEVKKRLKELGYI